MKRLLRPLIYALMLALTPAAAFAEGQTIGTTALLDRIAEARGKVVLVNFFASFCPPCREEIPGLIRLRAQFSPDQLEIIGVSVDNSLADMDAFVPKYDFNYPVFYGGEEVAFAFRVSGIPHNVIYNREGSMVVNQAGYLPEEDLVGFLRDMLNRKS